jgi:hypothetical protein
MLSEYPVKEAYMLQRKKNAWLVLGVAIVSLVMGTVAAYGLDFAAYVVGDTAAWLFNNGTGTTVTGFHIEFDQAVTITSKVEWGGLLPALGGATGTTFDFNGGTLVAGGTLDLEWQPASAVPTYAMWMNGAQPAGAPYFTTIAQLGYLFGQGIVHVREVNPAALNAAFAQFFADNADYLASVSQALGMSLADSLMPIILTAPAEGIQNFFSTIVGMLGVTSLEGVLQGDVNFSSLFALLGL